MSGGMPKINASVRVDALKRAPARRNSTCGPESFPKDEIPRLATVKTSLSAPTRSRSSSRRHEAARARPRKVKGLSRISEEDLIANNINDNSRVAQQHQVEVIWRQTSSSKTNPSIRTPEFMAERLRLHQKIVASFQSDHRNWAAQIGTYLDINEGVFATTQSTPSAPLISPSDPRPTMWRANRGTSRFMHRASRHGKISCDPTVSTRSFPEISASYQQIPDVPEDSHNSRTILVFTEDTMSIAETAADTELLNDMSTTSYVTTGEEQWAYDRLFGCKSTKWRRRKWFLKKVFKKVWLRSRRLRGTVWCMCDDELGQRSLTSLNDSIPVVVSRSRPIPVV